MIAQSMGWIVVVIAHFVGDYALLNEYLAVNKIKFPYVRLAHSIIWSGCILAALAIVGVNLGEGPAWWTPLWVSVFLVSTHFLADGVAHKSRVDLYMDQGYHILCVLILWALLTYGQGWLYGA